MNPQLQIKLIIINTNVYEDVSTNYEAADIARFRQCQQSNFRLLVHLEWLNPLNFSCNHIREYVLYVIRGGQPIM